MKNLKLAVMALTLIATMTACRSKQQQIPSPKGEVDWEMPCHGEGFFSTPQLIRANGIGRSMDQQMANRQARSAALEDLGTKIRVSVNTLIHDYYRGASQNLTEDLIQRFEGGTDLVVREQISGYRVICQRMTRDLQTNNFMSYMAIEIGVDEITKAIHNRLTQDQILRIDYNFEQFRERFNDEMKKRENR